MGPRVSTSISEGLSQYSIGPKLRGLRRRKNIGLVELGEHTGFSPALLSKVERGKLFPTLPTLLRIARVFGLGLDHFFAEEHQGRIWVWSASQSVYGSRANRGTGCPLLLWVSG